MATLGLHHPKPHHAVDTCVAKSSVQAHIRTMPAKPKSPVAKPAAAKPAAAKSAAKTSPVVGSLKKGDHVFLVDGSGYIFRAYHALPPLTRKSDGLQINAVLGFCNMLWKLLNDMKPEERPTHLAVVFDKSEKTFRTDFYPEYKAQRPDIPGGCTFVGRVTDRLCDSLSPARGTEIVQRRPSGRQSNSVLPES